MLSLLALCSTGLAAGVADPQASPPEADLAVDLDRALADVAWLIDEIGPRPAGSRQERDAVVGIAERLLDAGWTPQPLGCPACVVACRGPEGGIGASRLFLAHPDSVPGSPGAVDNAAGVAALLELARTTTATDLCLGFPPGEEAGLVGARAMAAAWPEPLPKLVVALDLTGQGRLSVTGLGPAWSGPALSWLLDTADVDSPYAYRAVSRALPHLERSDHLPFARRGTHSLHLLGRGQGGVFARYHQPEDDAVDRAALGDLITALDALATAPLPDAIQLDGATGDAAATLGRLVLPQPAVFLLLVLGALSGLRDLLRPCEGPPVLGGIKGLAMSLWRCLVATASASAALAALTLTGWLPTAVPEATASSVMGIPTSGWWVGALPGLVLGWAVWLVARKLLGGGGSGPLAATVLGGLALTVDPLLALPFAAAALLCRVHPVLGALPALYLLWPSKLQELAFHGLLPPAWWGALWLLSWPAFGARARGPLSRHTARRRRDRTSDNRSPDE